MTGVQTCALPISHKGAKVEALRLTSLEILDKIEELKKHDAVLIDEAQFFDEILSSVVWELLKTGVNVYASGLDMNFLGKGFPTMNRLMAMADEVKKFHAVCEECGADAVVTGKRNFKEHGDIVEIGEKDLYMPLCRECFLKFMEEGA